MAKDKKDKLEYFEKIVRILYENSVKHIKIGFLEIEFHDTYTQGFDENDFEEIIN